MARCASKPTPPWRGKQRAPQMALDPRAPAPIHPVILSGGSGTRLWPMSRTHYPKQFLPLAGDKTLLQQAALRVPGASGFAAPIVIANEEHRFLIAEQLREIAVAPHALLLEPVGRNTAPAVR